MQAPEFWHGGGPLSNLLAPLGWAYGWGSQLRRAAVGAPWHSPVPVVCVGNVVAGGAGKTPVALDLGRRLGDGGTAVHFLTRGYGGSVAGPVRVDAAAHVAAEVGDEALLLARVAPTWVSRDRVAGARAAAESGAEFIVMDDGFQNPRLAKNLSFLVIDGVYGLGNGKRMPAGPLRELLPEALARADAVAIVGDDRTGVGRLVDETGVSRLRADIVAAGGGAGLAGRRVVAFAGIGRPEKFFDTLASLGCDVVAACAYPDHFPYREREIARLKEIAAGNDATLITTEKDAVRIDPGLGEGIEVLTIGLRWEDETALEAILRRALD